MDVVQALIKKFTGHGPQRLLTVFEQFNAEFREDVLRKQRHVANKPWFNGVITLVILVNTIVLGLEVDYSRGQKLADEMPFFVAGFFFAVVFQVEMIIRINQLRWDYFLDPWNIFDYSLVVLAWADLVSTISTGAVAQMRLATALRIARLLRIVRLIKGIRVMSGLWLIIQGLLDSMRTVSWVALFMFFLVYTCAVVLTELVGSDVTVQATWVVSNQYIGSVFKSMWTITQVFTLDCWAEQIARPMFAVAPISTVVLILSITVLNWGTLNILLAVLIERMQNMNLENRIASEQRLEKAEAKLLESLGQDFKDADIDGKGELEFKEFQLLIRERTLKEKLNLLGIPSAEAEDLFDVMDGDKSGTVSPMEFIEGLQRIKGQARGQDIVQLICFAQKECLRASRFVARLQALNKKADQIQERLDSVGVGMGRELQGRVNADVRNDQTWEKAAERQIMLGKLDMERRITFPALSGNEKAPQTSHHPFHR